MSQAVMELPEEAIHEEEGETGIIRAIASTLAPELTVAIYQQAQRSTANLLMQYEHPKEFADLVSFARMVMTATVIWAVKEGFVSLTEKGLADAEEAVKNQLSLEELVNGRPTEDVQQAGGYL